MKTIKILVSTLLLTLAAGSAFAGTYQDTTANNSFQSAVDLSPYFGNGFSADIGDASGANTSLLAPWVTIHGHGDNGYDYYKVTTKAAGQLILDIDYTFNHPSNPHGFDTNLNLYNSAFTQIAYDDDQNSASGAGGSVHSYDSFLQLDNLAAGTYYIRVSKHSSNPIPVGGDYTLQVQGNVALVPEPESYAMMGLGLGLVGFMARRRKTKQA
jgi:hypothetical protein